MLVLVFSEISYVQASVSLNPVRTSGFLLQYDETTLKEGRLSCDVSCQLCEGVLCVLGLSMQPGLSGCCASSKADRGHSGSWWLCI